MLCLESMTTQGDFKLLVMFKMIIHHQNSGNKKENAELHKYVHFKKCICLTSFYSDSPTFRKCRQITAGDLSSRLIRWLSSLAHFSYPDSWTVLANVLVHYWEITQSGIFTHGGTGEIWNYLYHLLVVFATLAFRTMNSCRQTHWGGAPLHQTARLQYFSGGQFFS